MECPQAGRISRRPQYLISLERQRIIDSFVRFWPLPQVLGQLLSYIQIQENFAECQLTPVKRCIRQK